MRSLLLFAAIALPLAAQDLHMRDGDNPSLGNHQITAFTSTASGRSANGILFSSSISQSLPKYLVGYRTTYILGPFAQCFCLSKGCYKFLFSIPSQVKHHGFLLWTLGLPCFFIYRPDILQKAFGISLFSLLASFFKRLFHNCRNRRLLCISSYFRSKDRIFCGFSLACNFAPHLWSS